MADPVFKHEVLSVTRIATSAVAAYRLVKLDTTDTNVVYPAAAYAWSFGVTLHAAAAGEPVKIAVEGVVPLQVDGNTANIAIGDGLAPLDGTTGKGRKAAGSASRAVRAEALAASTTDGDIIPVHLCRFLTTA